MVGDMCCRGHAWHLVCMMGGIHGGGMHHRGSPLQGVCVAGGMYGRMVCMVGACVAEGHVWQGGMRGRGPCMAGEMATAAGSMHPTGMHSHSMSKLTLNKIAKMTQ